MPRRLPFAWTCSAPGLSSLFVHRTERNDLHPIRRFIRAAHGMATGFCVKTGRSVKGSLRLTFNYGGRATRREYWLFALAMTALNLLAESVETLASRVGSVRPDLLADVKTAATELVVLAALPTTLNLYVRRLHDLDRSGWWLLALAFLDPFTVAGFWLSAAAILALVLWPGKPGANRYGTRSTPLAGRSIG